MSEEKKERKTELKETPSMEVVNRITKPFNDYFTPQYFGLDKVAEDKPALYITNHSFYGFLDGIGFISEIYKKKGFIIRSLADDMHFGITGWKDLITYFGMVRGSRENCAELMEAGEHVLVYPGGGRETFKLKDEKYTLTWKKRLGFARMAIEYGYDIIPITTVGADDAYDVIADSEDILNSFVGKLFGGDFLEKTLKKGEYIPPIGLGLLGSPFPKPVKLYTAFSDRIDTKRFNGKEDDEEVLWQVRNEVELAMYKKMIELMEYRKDDKSVNWFRKLLAK